MHKKVRRHSALLLVMAPVLAIGSTFLVAGSATASVKPKNVKPTITVCKAVAGSFHFAINGKSVTISKACVTVAGKVGVNHVSETWAPANYRSVSSISVSPAAARVSTSVHTASATVRLASHGAATVKFVNAKVVTKVVSKSGALQTTGTVEICKYAADNWVEGSFPFTVTSGGATQTVAPVNVGGCSTEYTVTAGTVTVTEGDVYPYQIVPSETTTTSGSLPIGSINSATGVITLTVNPDQNLTLLVTDGTTLNYYKACKVLSNSQGSLTGDTFWFNSTWTFQPPTEPAGTVITGSGTQSVIATVPNVSECSGLIGAPAGSIVTMNEAPFPDVLVTSVVVFGASSNTSSGSTAMFGLENTPATAGAVTSATFTNEPQGYIEVCKDFAPSTYDTIFSAEFTVNGGTPFWVSGGDCSAPIEVPAGTASVTEMVPNDFYVSGVTTVSASDPLGARLLSGATANPASVTVPYGGVGNETVVTFTNSPAQTQFKICKQETSSDANLAGATFTFTYSWDDSADSMSGSGSVDLTIATPTASNPTGLVCSGLFWGPPAITSTGYSAGSKYYPGVNITETSTDIPGVEVTSIGYQGNGLLIYDSTDGGTKPVLVTGGSAASCIDPGAGINVVTYTNGRTAGADS